MTTNKTYCVAGHVFSVCFPNELDDGKLLSSYEPFQIDGETAEAECLFTVDIVIEQPPQLGEPVKRFNECAPYIWVFKRADGMLNFGFSHNPDYPAALLVFNGSNARLYIKPDAQASEKDNAVNNAMMLMFTYNTGRRQTLMIHASVSVKDGLGYVFLGKSGTGKSTHSRMWMENLPDVWLLNDDNPAIRIIDGRPFVFGTPWSGKTPCYKNASVPVQAIVKLEQYPSNVIRRMSSIEGYAALMPSCSSMKWDSAWADAQHGTLEEVIRAISCWHLRCLPDADAAKLCYKTCKVKEL